jgi:hypothetical protein
MSAEMIFEATAQVVEKSAAASNEELIARYWKGDHFTYPSFTDWGAEHPNGTFYQYCQLKHAIHALRIQLREQQARQEQELREFEERERRENAEINGISAAEAAIWAMNRQSLPKPVDDTDEFVQNTLICFNQSRAHTFKKFYTASGRRETVNDYTYYQFLALAQKYGYNVTQFKPSFKDGRPVASY